MRATIFLLLTLGLASCGGGSSGDPDPGNSPTPSDTTPPSGYGVLAPLSVGSDDQDSVGFEITGGEIGSSFSYSFIDDEDSEVQGSGQITEVDQSINGVDLSSLSDGIIQLEVSLRDVAGNEGATETAFFPKSDTAPPMGYSISDLTDPITSSNHSLVSFVLSGAEVGATYRYAFTDDLAAQITAIGRVSSPSQNFTNIDLRSLVDGEIELQLTLTDASNNIGSVEQLTTNKDAVIGVTEVELSGTVTFDRVPHDIDGIGLDYASQSPEPVREATLRVVDASGDTLATTKTDQNGVYQVEVPADTLVRVEVLAELFEADPSLNWLVRVTENSTSASLYVLQGALVDSRELDQVRDLHADSGWGGSGYIGERAAAPFAILDSIYKIYERLRSEGVDLSLPELNVRWDTSNSNGSFYRSGIDNYIEIAGQENLDVDEYDEHVIVHEWRHYYEDVVSRGDAIGGFHSVVSLLEPRTAFSEGVGNAWSAIILEDPIYKDASGFNQQSGFQLDIEGSGLPDAGWYIEKSVQEILYDLVDTNNEGVDDISISLAELIQVWQSPFFLEQTSLTTIYSFREALKQVVPAQATEIDDLYANENILGSGSYGIGETNSSGLSYSLPVYHELSPNGVPIEICSDNQADGEYNRLENRQLVRFGVDTAGSHTIEMSRDAGNSFWAPLMDADPDFYVYLRGSIVAGSTSVPADIESWTGDLELGEHIIDAYDWFNVDEFVTTGGLICYDLSVLKN